MSTDTVYVGRTPATVMSHTRGDVWQVMLEGQDWPVHVHAHEIRATPEPDAVGAGALAWGVIGGAGTVVFLVALYVIAVMWR